MSYPLNNILDNALELQANFVYSIQNFEELQQKLTGIPENIKIYALNRWFFYWAEQAVYDIVTSRPKKHKIQEFNQKSNLVTLQGVPFQIKTKIFPHQFCRTLPYALSHKEELIYWLYRYDQKSYSKQFKNSIFIFLYREAGEHWKLFAELQKLEKILTAYFENFNIQKTTRLHHFNNQKIYADVVWYIHQT